MYRKNLHNLQYTSPRHNHVYADILSAVFIYRITDPELRNTDLLLCRIKSHLVSIKKQYHQLEVEESYQSYAE